MRKLKMTNGNINRALLYLRTLEVKHWDNVERRKLIQDSIIALDKFSRTPEGFEFDQRDIKGVHGEGLLTLARDEMKKYL
jgi:hypothetical protein